MKTKKELIENLIREGRIGLDEALVLLETEKETIYVPIQPYQIPYYPRPWDWLNPPVIYTTTNGIAEIQELATSNSEMIIN